MLKHIASQATSISQKRSAPPNSPKMVKQSPPTNKQEIEIMERLFGKQKTKLIQLLSTISPPK